jgi:hypothetical protein
LAAKRAPIAHIDNKKTPVGKPSQIQNIVRLAEYPVRHKGQTERFPNIGEAYIAAGEKTGTKT